MRNGERRVWMMVTYYPDWAASPIHVAFVRRIRLAQMDLRGPADLLCRIL